MEGNGELMGWMTFVLTGSNVTECFVSFVKCCSNKVRVNSNTCVRRQQRLTRRQNPELLSVRKGGIQMRCSVSVSYNIWDLKENALSEGCSIGTGQ